MKKYIALLRGINVSGQKKIKMADLRIHLETAGFLNVQTYIQSGNIVLSSTENNPTLIAKKIESVIDKEFGFKVPTLVITPEYLNKVINESPYLKDKNREKSKMYFAFLYSNPTTENIDKLSQHTFEGEEIIIQDTMTYLYYEVGAGRAKLSNNFIESKLKLTSSARNYNTVVKLIEMTN